MSYQKTNWVDQSVEKPKTYKFVYNNDDSVTLVDFFGDVEELGTPVNAENMNHIEEGISACGLRKYSSLESYDLNENVINEGDSNLYIYKSLVNNNTGNSLENKTYWKKISLEGSSLLIGSEVALHCSSTYVPKGCLPMDGAEYQASLFVGLWEEYLTGETPKLLTCTYEEYQNEINTYGQCTKFAIDIQNQKFKVPFKKDGSFTQQALSDNELGKQYKAGLPNITGSIGNTLNTFGMESGQGAFQNSVKNPGGVAGTGAYKLSLDFNASLSNSIYGNSNTVQPVSQALRYFIVVSNSNVDDLSIDWSNYISSLEGKANIDADNFSSTGKETIAKFGIPDYANPIASNVALPNGTEVQYQATQNCFVVVEAGGYGGSDQVISAKILIQGKLVSSIQETNSSGAGEAVSAFAAKGQTLTLVATANVTTSVVRKYSVYPLFDNESEV